MNDEQAKSVFLKAIEKWDTETKDGFWEWLDSRGDEAIMTMIEWIASTLTQEEIDNIVDV